MESWIQELKRLEERSQDGWKQRYSRAISPKESEEMQNRGVERGLNKECIAKEYHFRSDPQTDNPICVIFVPLTTGIYRRKT